MRIARPFVEPSTDTAEFTFDGRRLPMQPGETIAAALAANGIAAIRKFDAGKPGEESWLGLYCGMGACYDCVVTVDGRTGQRACITKLSGGEIVRSSQPDGTLDDPLLPLTAMPSSSKRAEVSVDILVVGAGPAGLFAALQARKAAATVTVIDECGQSGGQ